MGFSKDSSPAGLLFQDTPISFPAIQTAPKTPPSTHSSSIDQHYKSPRSASDGPCHRRDHRATMMDSPAKITTRRGGEEEGEEHHQNPFISNITSYASSSKLQFRKETSKACWDEELGMGEVVEKKGSLWSTTGIVWGGNLYCHIEEILFLAERGALLLSGSDGTTLSIKDIYKKVAEGKDGFSWEFFEAYRHLKSLGYIVGRHGIPWIMKSNMICCTSNSPQSTFDSDGGLNVKVDRTTSIIQLFKGMQLNEMKPNFDVYLPNSKFRKSAPGDPSFLLCLLREKPPSIMEVEDLEKKCNGIPMKYCFVDHGRD